MAAPHVFVAYDIMDAKGKKSTMKINFPIATDIAILQTFISSTATMIDAIIKGQIVEAGIGLAVALPGGLKAAPLADADVEEGARFNWNAASGANTGFRMPSFDEAFIETGGTAVDVAATEVDDFVQRILAGQTVGIINVSPSDNRGSDVTALESAYEQFASSRP